MTQEQARRDPTIGRAGTFADGRDRDVYIFGWLSSLFAVGALGSAVAAIHFAFESSDIEPKTAATWMVVAVFAVVGSAVLALCGIIRATELRIRRGR